MNALVDATVNALNAGAIKSTDAEAVRTIAIQANTLLNGAEEALGQGDTQTSNARLQLAEGLLRQLQGYIKVQK